MDIRITGPQETPPVAIANAWGAGLRDRLAEAGPGRSTVAWTEDRDAPAQTPPALRQWLVLRRGATLLGRVGLRWDQAQPGLLRVLTEVDALPEPELRFEVVLDILAWVLGLAAFGTWVWFAVVDWRRVWNRVFTLTSGYDATHATHLEVVWMLLGWALSPAVAILVVELVRSRIKAMAAAWQRRRVQAFTRSELDPALEAAVQELLKEAARDPKATLALGQAHPGQAHPVHADLVWAANGRYQPAAGFTWASDDPASMEVVRKAEGP